MQDYILYGAKISYFTAKARAYLNWRGVSYREENATIDVYKDIIMPNVGWPVIPVMQTPDGNIVQDTADIIAHVESASNLQPPALPEDAFQAFVSLLLQLYADEWLVIPAMHYRWNYNEDFAYSEFGALSLPDATPEVQHETGKHLGKNFRGALPMLGVSPVTVPGIEASYEAFLKELSAHLNNHAYLLGARASLADFAFVGPLYAHLYRDPASGEIMKRIAPNVFEWVGRIAIDPSREGALVEAGTVPDTLLPIIKRQMKEQLPTLLETTRMFAGWASDQDPGTNLPRGLGELEINIEEHRGKAAARSFPLWRLQAAMDVFHEMDAENKKRATTFLNEVGGDALIDFKLPARLARKNFKLALA